MKNKGVFYNLCQLGLKGGGSAHRPDLRAFPRLGASFSQYVSESIKRSPALLAGGRKFTPL